MNRESDLEEPLLKAYPLKKPPRRLSISTALPPESEVIDNVYIPPLFSALYWNIRDLKNLLFTSKAYFFSIIYLICWYDLRHENLLSPQLLKNFFNKCLDEHESIDLTANASGLIDKIKNDQDNIDAILVDGLVEKKYSVVTARVEKRYLCFFTGSWLCGVSSCVGLGAAGITSAITGVTPLLHRMFIALGISSGLGLLAALSSFIRFYFFLDKINSSIRNKVEKEIPTYISKDEFSEFKKMIHHTFWLESNKGKGQLPRILHEIYYKLYAQNPSITNNLSIFLKYNTPKNWKSGTYNTFLQTADGCFQL